MALLIDNLILQSQEFSEHLMLPWSMQPLLTELGKTLVISENNNLAMLQILMPLLNRDKDSHELLLISSKSAAFRAKCFTQEG
jgi:hypothetical protein